MNPVVTAFQLSAIVTHTRAVCGLLSKQKQTKNISGVKLVIQSIHRDWTKKVMYVPNSDSFISCSMDQDTSLYFGETDTLSQRNETPFLGL